MESLISRTDFVTDCAAVAQFQLFLSDTNTAGES